jgi:hypothetical protein
MPDEIIALIHDAIDHCQLAMEYSRTQAGRDLLHEHIKLAARIVRLLDVRGQTAQDIARQFDYLAEHNPET